MIFDDQDLNFKIQTKDSEVIHVIVNVIQLIQLSMSRLVLVLTDSIKELQKETHN